MPAGIQRNFEGASRVTSAKGLLVAATISAAFLLALAAEAQKLPSPADHDWMKTWIPVHCCVTNNCCFEISAREVASRGNDEWTILATGQVRPRTDWSPDGKYYRCACDLSDGQWIVHQGASTRCLFVPMQSVSPARTKRTPQG
jgi:hypothetical protein